MFANEARPYRYIPKDGVPRLVKHLAQDDMEMRLPLIQKDNEGKDVATMDGENLATPFFSWQNPTYLQSLSSSVIQLPRLTALTVPFLGPHKLYFWWYIQIATWYCNCRYHWLCQFLCSGRAEITCVSFSLVPSQPKACKAVNQTVLPMNGDIL